ncbi:MAG: S24 family peptidase [Candidatus Competibacteraceae bacterium]|jgi:phage repressor protein C with HTH and peptisase S24 domain|nr:S24 family peptidase [Candidatus Competibacteraceae bacterium]
MKNDHLEFSAGFSHLGLGERIRLVRNDHSRDDFSAAIGVSRNTLMRYERGERCPDAEFLYRICERYQVNPTWLLLGTELIERSPLPIQESSNSLSEEFALVPLYSVEVSAGYGAAIEQEQPQTRLAFRQDWLKEMGLQEEKVVAVLASGDSMADTLHGGDVLLVDTQQRQVISDAIYILRQSELLYVKRLQRLLDGSLRISSDNRAYTEEVIPPDGLAYLDVIGRVVWRGGRL